MTDRHRALVVGAGIAGLLAARLVTAVLPPVQRAMAAEPEVFRRFLEAMHMTRSSTVLLHPHLRWGHTPSRAS
ncbi:hypothetical protein [Kitasatospora sp. NPDC094011]|uniref:hypothetical protein n=1 Tax=Kitasatospora sp. NPDC094011 TaxID=3364090 RepID=UPI0038115483